MHASAINYNKTHKHFPNVLICSPTLYRVWGAKFEPNRRILPKELSCLTLKRHSPTPAIETNSQHNPTAPWNQKLIARASDKLKA